MRRGLQRILNNGILLVWKSSKSHFHLRLDELSRTLLAECNGTIATSPSQPHISDFMYCSKPSLNIHAPSPATQALSLDLEGKADRCKGSQNYNSIFVLSLWFHRACLQAFFVPFHYVKSSDWKIHKKCSFVTSIRLFFIKIWEEKSEKSERIRSPQTIRFIYPDPSKSRACTMTILEREKELSHLPWNLDEILIWPGYWSMWRKIRGMRRKSH